MNTRQKLILAPIGVVLLLLIVTLWSGFYRLDETQQAVILQFGEPIGDPVILPGLHWKTPFIQEVRLFDKRVLAWDGSPNQIPTGGREFISVDTTARWRIAEPLRFLQSVTDETGAQSRLDDIIDSVVRDKISGSDLVEIVRSSDWDITEEDLEQIEDPAVEQSSDLTRQVQKGRQQLTREILEEARRQMPEYGIELVDVRIKRLNYIADVRQQVFDRMISERQRIAEQFRSEGQGEASRIKGETSRDLAKIRSEAQRKAEIIRGQADAEATGIYSSAYNQEPDFYAFLRTLESYEKTLDSKTILMMSAESDYFRFLKRTAPGQPGQQDGQ
ncbi:MAG: protease modulator HflC [Phycisphaerae bacterium]